MRKEIFRTRKIGKIYILNNELNEWMNKLNEFIYQFLIIKLLINFLNAFINSERDLNIFIGTGYISVFYFFPEFLYNF